MKYQYDCELSKQTKSYKQTFKIAAYSQSKNIWNDNTSKMVFKGS